MAWSVAFSAWVLACHSGENAPPPTPVTTTSGVGASTTTSSGAGTSTGGTGAGAAGGGGHGAGASCEEPGFGEPNETEATAYELAPDPIDDCDGNGGQFSGAIVGANDVDWFAYRGNDSWCVVNPSRELDPPDHGVRVCAFFACVSSDTELDGCPAGADEATSPDGRPGCCNSSGFTVSDINCPGTIDDDAFVYIRIDVPSADPSTCAHYTVDYHY
jgi:hypothetical protein